MQALTNYLLVFIAAVFVSGLLTTAFTGTARLLKITLVVLTLLFTAALVAGFIFSGGLLIFLVFQIISAIIILYFVIIAGAAAGWGIYSLAHKRGGGRSLKAEDLEAYLALADFAAREGITEARALARIKSGYYTGGRVDGHWYVHKSELSA